MKTVILHDITYTHTEVDYTVLGKRLQERLQNYPNVPFYATFPLPSDGEVTVNPDHIAGRIVSYDAERKIYECQLLDTTYGTMINKQPNVHYSAVMVYVREADCPSNAMISQIRILHSLDDKEVSTVEHTARS